MEPEQQTQVPLISNKWNQVTPLSKYLAMVLFIVLPFIGGWIGYRYAPEKVVEVEKVILKETNVQESQNEKTASKAMELALSFLYPYNLPLSISDEYSPEIEQPSTVYEYRKVELDGFEQIFGVTVVKELRLVAPENSKYLIISLITGKSISEFLAAEEKEKSINYLIDGRRSWFYDQNPPEIIANIILDGYKGKLRRGTTGLSQYSGSDVLIGLEDNIILKIELLAIPKSGLSVYDTIEDELLRMTNATTYYISKENS